MQRLTKRQTDALRVLLQYMSQDDMTATQQEQAETTLAKFIVDNGYQRK